MTSPAEPATSLRIYLRLLGHVRPFIGLFVVSIVGYVIYASSQRALAAILKYFVDGLTAPPEVTHHHFPLLGKVQLIWGVPILVVLISVWQGIGSFLGNYYLARVSFGLIDDLRCRLFDSLLRLPNTYFDQHNSGHLVSRIT